MNSTLHGMYLSINKIRTVIRQVQHSWTHTTTFLHIYNIFCLFRFSSENSFFTFPIKIVFRGKFFEFSHSTFMFPMILCTHLRSNHIALQQQKMSVSSCTPLSHEIIWNGIKIYTDTKKNMHNALLYSTLCWMRNGNWWKARECPSTHDFRALSSYILIWKHWLCVWERQAEIYNPKT